jgi:hypothetical protein
MIELRKAGFLANDKASMRAQTIPFLLVDRVKGKLNCRPYRGGGEGNPKRLVEAASHAFSNRLNFLTIRVRAINKYASPRRLDFGWCNGGISPIIPPC